ncbi:hypothetical protein BBK82_04545 [Lentzea guizhouensis]|uniref:PPE family domain-containing protein n=1 Tax=Lentzea guizhouensis TaxID=1586287 RepID=A0A1B2HCK1_9PSEU|nr:WXG100 family type VII secretion target [Lentzea guizhouensis]ANZ35457.1 hypothetical protein BBK82_04545 [Lentzea guizhouensis]
MTRPAPSCATEDNTRADGFTGHQIYAQMHGGPGTGSAQHAADKATELGQTYAQLEARLKRVGETLGESWTGASADAAQTAGNPINQAMIQMQDALRQADQSLSNQVYQFNYNKAQLRNMPEKAPDTGFWDDVTPWDTDTEDAANKYQGDEAHNRRIYTEFQGASNTNRGELPQEFPGVTADNLNVQVVDNSGSNNQNNTTNTSGITRPSGSTGFPSPTGSPQGPTGSTFTPPTGIGNGDTTTSWSPGGGTGGGGGGGGGGLKPGGDLGLGTNKPPIGSVIDRPITAGIPPIGVPGGPDGGGRGPAVGAGGGKLGGPGAGGGGKFGTGGLGGSAGTGTGTGSGTGSQPGNKAGMFSGMGENANAANRAGATAGAAGKAGAAGMGGMGGAGARGQGDEDKEHKSADYLVTEENTNELIGDMPMVAPPTIGG